MRCAMTSGDRNLAADAVRGVKRCDYTPVANITVIETAEKYGVRSYIFVPCIVYGEGKGFGNKISIQTVAVVTAAKGSGTVYDVNPEDRVCAIRKISRRRLAY